MAQDDNVKTIKLGVVLQKLWKHKRFFFIVWPVTAVLSYLLILGAPRYYATDAKLAPELGSGGEGSAISSIASSFGFDLGETQNGDAISPLLYPDLMEDNGFVTSLFSIRVKTIDGSVDTDYYTYLKKHQKQAWWSKLTRSLTGIFGKKKSETNGSGTEELDPYNLPESVSNVADAIRGSVMLSLNDKTGVITVKVNAQDPLVCKIVADSVVVRLRDFITDYRTNKARIDEKHYSELAEQAMAEYEKARTAYAAYADRYSNAVLSTYKTQEDALLNEMQLKYTTYTTVSAQLQQVRAKVQERTPAFTLLKGASVPIRPAGPKRLYFVFFMLVMVTMISSVYILRKDIKKIIIVQE